MGNALQPAVARAGFAHRIIKLPVETFDRIRPLFEQRGHRVGGRVDVIEREQGDRLALRPRYQIHFRLEHDHAGAFGAGHGARDIEVAAGQQRVEVLEARHEARDFREALLDQPAVSVAKGDECPVDVAAPADLDRRNSRSGPELELQAVVSQRGQPLDIVRRPSPPHGMHATAVVPDHPSEGVVVVGGGIGAERQPMRSGRVAQPVENAAWFDPCQPRIGIDVEHAVEMPREVDAYGDIAALAGEARPAAARDNRRLMLAAYAHGLDDLVAAAGIDQADRHLAVIGSIGRVERLRLRAELHRSAERVLHVRLECTSGIRRVTIPFTQHLPVGRTRREPRLAIHHTSSRTVSDASVSAVFIA